MPILNNVLLSLPSIIISVLSMLLVSAYEHSHVYNKYETCNVFRANSFIFLRFFSYIDSIMISFRDSSRRFSSIDFSVFQRFYL